MAYYQELANAFNNLGFTGYPDFCKSEQNWTGLPDQRPPLLDLKVLYELDPEVEIDYLFIVGQSNEKTGWELHSIRASHQMETVRNQEEVLVVGKTYVDPLPTKEQIRKEMMQLIQIQNVLEELAMLNFSRIDLIKLQQSIEQNGIARFSFFEKLPGNQLNSVYQIKMEFQTEVSVNEARNISNVCCTLKEYESNLSDTKDLATIIYKHDQGLPDKFTMIETTNQIAMGIERGSKVSASVINEAVRSQLKLFYRNKASPTQGTVRRIK